MKSPINRGEKLHFPIDFLNRLCYNSNIDIFRGGYLVRGHKPKGGGFMKDPSFTARLNEEALISNVGWEREVFYMINGSGKKVIETKELTHGVIGIFFNTSFFSPSLDSIKNAVHEARRKICPRFIFDSDSISLGILKIFYNPLTEDERAIQRIVDAIMACIRNSEIQEYEVENIPQKYDEP